eukprot:6207282-Pleurochrysis_carterae.AAC.1
MPPPFVFTCGCFSARMVSAATASDCVPGSFSAHRSPSSEGSDTSSSGRPASAAENMQILNCEHIVVSTVQRRTCNHSKGEHTVIGMP